MDDTQQLLNDLRENYTDYYKKLVAYVLWLAENRRDWRNGDSGTLPGGRRAEDIAQEVILKVLNGDRNSYDPTKGTVIKWLRQQAWSIVDALAKSATNRHEQVLPDEDRLSDDSSSPEDALIEKERLTAIEHQANVLLEIQDTSLKSIVEAILDGCEPKPRFLADVLRTDVDDVNNRLKRLRRLVKKGETVNE